MIPAVPQALPRYESDATILMKGRDLNALSERIEESYPIPGKGLTARSLPTGIELSADEFAYPAYHVIPRQDGFRVLPGASGLSCDDDPVIVPVISSYEGVQLDEDQYPIIPRGIGSFEFWIRFTADTSELIVLAADDDLDELAEGEAMVKIFAYESTVDSLNVIFRRTGSIDFLLPDICSSSSSSSSSSSGGSDVPPPEESSDLGDSKSTAIVPASWALSGYVAMFITEMPEVRFEDVETLKLTSRRARIAVDPQFVELCESGSLKCCGYAPNRPVPLGLVIEELMGETFILVEQPAEGPLATEVTVRFTAIRRGFAGTRLPERTEQQFHENNAFINSAYSGDKAGKSLKDHA